MYEFKVEGMSCGHCVQSITKSLTALDKTAKVVVDLAGKTVKVESQKAQEALAHEIEEAGYTVVSGKQI